MLDFFKTEEITIKRKTYTEETDDFGENIYINELLTIRGYIGLISTKVDTESIGQNVENKYRIVIPGDSKVYDGDIFIVRGTYWQKDGIAYNQPSIMFDDFLPNMIVINLKQYSNNSNSKINNNEEF